jgi:hypothetical protein
LQGIYYSLKDNNLKLKIMANKQTSSNTANGSVQQAETLGQVIEGQAQSNQSRLGKYVFRFDYEKTIYNKEAIDVIKNAPVGKKYDLPVGSYRTLQFSKGDVVDVVAFGKKNVANSAGVLQDDLRKKIIKTPSYIQPIGAGGFSEFITIDDTQQWLQKVSNSTPTTLETGVNFGKNLRPVYKTVADNTQTPTPDNTDTGFDSTTSIGFFDDRNNLIIVAGVLVLGYLLFSNKSE